MAATNPFDPTANQTALTASKSTIQDPTTNADPSGAGTTGGNTGTTGTNTSGANQAPAGAPTAAAAPSTGLLANAMSNPVTASTTAGTTQQATSTPWNVTAPQTVAGQLNNVISEGSPLFDKAKADAAQTANGRGLLNSAMAAGAGTSALLDKALQIATPDAQTNAAAGAANAASQNTTSLANAQSANAAIAQDAAAKQQAQATNLSAGVQTATTAYQGALQTALQNASEADKITLSNIDSQVRTNLAQIQAQYQTQMQTSQSSASMYSQTMNSIGQIMQDKDLDGSSKQVAIDQIMQRFKDGLNIQLGISNIPGVASLVSNLSTPTNTGALAGGPASLTAAQQNALSSLGQGANGSTPTPNAIGGGSTYQDMYPAGH